MTEFFDKLQKLTNQLHKIKKNKKTKLIMRRMFECSHFADYKG